MKVIKASQGIQRENGNEKSFPVPMDFIENR